MIHNFDIESVHNNSQVGGFWAKEQEKKKKEKQWEILVQQDINEINY